jgi:hypothetical protein
MKLLATMIAIGFVGLVACGSAPDDPTEGKTESTEQAQSSCLPTGAICAEPHKSFGTCCAPGWCDIPGSLDNVARCAP